jgi:hypothetical protein
MMPSEKIAMRDSAPPVKTIARPPTPPWICSMNCASFSGSMPGIGMWVPRR